MPRHRLTLEELVANGGFDAGNHRHPRRLQDSRDSALYPAQPPATLWHHEGVPTKALAERVGHADAAMTLNLYSHVLDPGQVPQESLEASWCGLRVVSTRPRPRRWRIQATSRFAAYNPAGRG